MFRFNPIPTDTRKCTCGETMVLISEESDNRCDREYQERDDYYACATCGKELPKFTAVEINPGLAKVLKRVGGIT